MTITHIGEKKEEKKRLSKSTTAFIAAGHHPKYPGAANITYQLAEHHEAKKILDLIAQCLLQRNILGGKQPPSPSPLQVRYVLTAPEYLHEKVAFINKEADKKGDDIAVEIHFNSSANQPNQACGIETLYFQGSEKGKVLADSIQKALLFLLPFSDRGIKERDNLYFLHKTAIPAVIVETFFIDNDREASYLFYPRSHLLIAQTIIRGIEDYYNR